MTEINHFKKCSKKGAYFPLSFRLFLHFFSLFEKWPAILEWPASFCRDLTGFYAIFCKVFNLPPVQNGGSAMFFGPGGPKNGSHSGGVPGSVLSGSPPPPRGAGGLAHFPSRSQKRVSKRVQKRGPKRGQKESKKGTSRPSARKDHFDKLIFRTGFLWVFLKTRF